MNPATPHPFEIRPLDAPALRECLPLSARRLGFAEVDQIPPWLIQTMVRYGGFALGAFEAGRVIGYSVSFPGYDRGRSFLFSSGLAVDHGFESRGVAMALKLRQRELALDAGYDVIKWTTTSLSSAPLNLYLSKLGGRLTRFHQDMYLSTLRPAFPDEVEIEWQLHRFPPDAPERPSAPTVLTSSALAADGVRTLTAANDPGDDPAARHPYLVEIPWDRDALLRYDPSAAADWSGRARTIMRALLDAGYVGTHVWPNRDELRSFVQFEQVDPTP